MGLLVPDHPKRLFDVYMAVDWSARNVPGPANPTRDALWIGERRAAAIDDSTANGETYWRTRRECLAHIRARLIHRLEAGRRVFLGFDFPYGYPAGYAAALGMSGEGSRWRQVWNELRRLVRDGEDNRNNRFVVAAHLNARCGGHTPGPLWGCPVNGALPTLLPTSPRYPYTVQPGLALQRLRWADRRVRGVQPVWKLYGNGSVGGQTIVGLPALCRLRDDPALASVSRVWPYETGFTSSPTDVHGPSVLHAEIWPGIVPEPLDTAVIIRDQAQVRVLVRWITHLDATGRLGALFAAPEGMGPEALAACVEEEGWILGG